MALNIKNRDVERLASEVARLAGETKTEAIRQALFDRRRRLWERQDPGKRVADLRGWLESEVWPVVRPEHLGRPLTQEEEDDILGYGPDGV